MGPIPALTGSMASLLTSTALPSGGSNSKATVIGVVAGLGSFIVGLLAAVFRLYKQYIKKRDIIKKKDSKDVPMMEPSHQVAAKSTSTNFEYLTPSPSNPDSPAMSLRAPSVY